MQPSISESLAFLIGLLGILAGAGACARWKEVFGPKVGFDSRRLVPWAIGLAGTWWLAPSGAAYWAWSCFVLGALLGVWPALTTLPWPVQVFSASAGLVMGLWVLRWTRAATDHFFFAVLFGSLAGGAWSEAVRWAWKAASRRRNARLLLGALAAAAVLPGILAGHREIRMEKWQTVRQIIVQDRMAAIKRYLVPRMDLGEALTADVPDAEMQSWKPRENVEEAKITYRVRSAKSDGQLTVESRVNESGEESIQSQVWVYNGLSVELTPAGEVASDEKAAAGVKIIRSHYQDLVNFYEYAVLAAEYERDVKGQLHYYLECPDIWNLVAFGYLRSGQNDAAIEIMRRDQNYELIKAPAKARLLCHVIRDKPDDPASQAMRLALADQSYVCSPEDMAMPPVTP